MGEKGAKRTHKTKRGSMVVVVNHSRGQLSPLEIRALAFLQSLRPEQIEALKAVLEPRQVVAIANAWEVYVGGSQLPMEGT